MFGALNRIIGRLDGDPKEQRPSNGGAFGFQVLRNNNTEVKLEPWFDFVIGINGRSLESGDPNLFASEVRNGAGSTISLGIWSAKGQRIKEIFLPIPRDNPTLGLSLQWMPVAATEDVWHILDVTPNSPADVAGLLAYGDYVIGSSAGLMHGEAGLGELVEDHLEKPLRLLVYNHEYNVTRPVDITPSRHWGGQGALGCTLGFGALHRIPAPLDEPPTAPGETMFDTGFDEKQPYISSASPAQDQYVPASAIPPPSAAGGDFLVPAEMNLQSSQLPSPGTAPPPKRDRKARAHHQIASPSSNLDDYFNEGEAKSREQDYAPTTKAGVPPPPPKTGPPPKATTPAPDT